MRIVAVDDEMRMLNHFEEECKRYDDVIIEKLFDDPEAALEYLMENPVDAVFLDIEMPGLDGLSLAAKIRERYPRIVLVFISAHEGYAAPALHLKPDYYLFKPYSSAELDAVIADAQLLTGRIKARIFIQCFGRFQIFSNGKPIVFKSGKAKELLAILVDRRGAFVGPEEAFNLIWEEKIYNNYTGSIYRAALQRLEDTLTENKCQEILIRTPKGCAVKRSVIECDYYDYLDGKNNLFFGEYMTDYSWGEYTAARLTIGNDK